MRPLTIAIDAQVIPGSSGSIEQVLIGLVHGLGCLDDGSEKYIIIGPSENPLWLSSYLKPNQCIVSRRAPNQAPLDYAKKMLGPFRQPLGRILRSISSKNRKIVDSEVFSVPVSDNFYESLNADVLHFPYPLHFVKTMVPTVYSIYDLQHRHFPQFFTTEHLRFREALLQQVFKLSRIIVTSARWVRDDLVKQYSLPLEKIVVAPLAAPTIAYQAVNDESLSRVRQIYRLPDAFILYPAMTYQHKNHVGLLEALALLRDRDNIYIPLVCTGIQRHFWPYIQQRLKVLNLSKQVTFLGYLPPQDLRALYRAARLLVFPSLFEGVGMPVLEAFYEQLPVACSNIESFTEYAGDSALFFNPTSPAEIANAVNSLWHDANLRDQLRIRGLERTQLYSWERTARIYRAVYRSVAGCVLSLDDRLILQDSIC